MYERRDHVHTKMTHQCCSFYANFHLSLYSYVLMSHQESLKSKGGDNKSLADQMIPWMYVVWQACFLVSFTPHHSDGRKCEISSTAACIFLLHLCLPVSVYYLIYFWPPLTKLAYVNGFWDASVWIICCRRVQLPPSREGMPWLSCEISFTVKGCSSSWILVRAAVWHYRGVIRRCL